MRCKKCGKENPGDADCCRHCGATAAAAFGAGPAKGQLLALAPTFSPFVTMWTCLLLSPLTLLFGGVFGGVILGVIFGRDHEPFSDITLGSAELPTMLPFVVSGVLATLALFVLVRVILKKTYERSEFRFFEDRVEYHEGFINVVEKTVDYKKIIEVELSKNMFQRKRNLGTIFLRTAASMGSDRSAGIRIPDIFEPDTHYGKIKDLVR